ncbi:hypothetical protein KFL_002370070 [Klebsormidium nitens]|uniref:phytol kinase n=1 Tax=Klebsormidium nitens TaxID=105231 RepID=A0A1Y1I4Q0_KLENI|nr:hypothetical protein KFL_002370070 [Klebsormidium nitens]|eukprot:GAQ85473.1 hypothetical protein KFL_002370070 [Klebsormidium nitens]
MAEEAEVTWKTSSRTYDEFEQMTPDNEQVSFDLGKPESSAWIQEILKEATCDDFERREFALWRFKEVFPGLLHEQGLGKGTECASYFLQRGFLREVHAGLAEAKTSWEWLLCPNASPTMKTGSCQILLINRIAVYATIITAMTLDERTTRFLLKDIEDLLKLLEATFYQSHHASNKLKVMEDFGGLVPEPRADARRAIVRAISRLVKMSARAKRFLLKRKDFYLCMIREIAGLFKENCKPTLRDEDYQSDGCNALALVLAVNEYNTTCEQESLLDEVLNLIARILTQSDFPPMLRLSLLALKTMMNREEIYLRLRRYRGVPEAFKAIAACTTYSEELRTSAAKFASRTAEIVVPQDRFPRASVSTAQQRLAIFKYLAEKDPAVKRRVERLAVAQRDSRARPDRVSKRKCSNPACKKLEGDEKFKMCRGCFLDIYCSADCQRIAWQGGHKKTCPRKDRRGSTKDNSGPGKASAHHRSMAREEAEVTWKQCSRSVQEFEELTPEEENDSFDLRKPDSSVWLKQILKEATCDDPERRLCALWRFKNRFPGLVTEQGLAKGADCVSYLLQRGFLKELQAGFPEARASGEWLLVSQPASTGGPIRNVFFINRVEVYASIVTAMTVDEMTARFFMKEIKDLLKLLEATFHQAQHAPSVLQLAQGRFVALRPEPRTEARTSIIEALSVLVGVSNKAKRFLAKRTKFYLCMIREVMQMTSEGSASGELTLRNAEHLVVTYYGVRLIRVLYESYPASKQESLPDDLRLVAQTLIESDLLPCIEHAVLILRTVVNLDQKEIFQKLLSHDGIPEALTAIAACKAYNDSLRHIAAYLASRAEVAPEAQCMCPENASALEELKLELCESRAESNPAVKHRVERLVAAERRNPLSKSVPADRRKCSNPACEKVETRDETFKTCRGCLLELYCSTDCQRAAWKAGHKQTCPRKDRQPIEVR